jgi:hypothetical protein
MNPVPSVNSSFGAGVHYNMPSGDISGTGFDSNYFSYVLSIRQRLKQNMSVEFSVDYYPGGNDIEQAVRPFAALIWGDLINFGAGVSRSYLKRADSGGEWSSLSYQVQGGVRFPIRNGVNLNIDAFYFLQEFGEIKDIDLENLTLAARLFFRF